VADLDEVAAELRLAHAPATIAETSVLRWGVDSNQEIVEALAPLLGEARCARLDAVAGARLASVAAVLEDLHDPHNLGACLRSCEAMGVHRVHIVSVRNRFRTSARVTQGCEKWLEIARHRSAAAAAAAVKAAGLKLYAAVPEAALTVGELDGGKPAAIAFGNEHTGLSPELRALADGEVRIAMHGFSQSLNVSVSAAIALSAITEARRRALGRAGDLDPRELLALRARWYGREVRGWEKVVERWRRESVERGGGAR
jgi:tRNA (guanosine-2'-O-)-methyltransferase